MKIFITIPWFTPAFKAGGPIQSIANMVVGYAPANIRYYVFCSNKDLDGTALTGITTDCWIDFNDHTKVWYSSVTSNTSNQLHAEVSTIAPDVLFVIGLFDWYYNIVPLLFCKVPLKILSVRGMLHEGALTQKRFKKQVFIKALQWWGIQKKVKFHATDAVEAQFIKNIFGLTAQVNIAANYPQLLAAQPLAVTKQPGTLVLCSMALISAMKNHLLVLQALQQCTSAIDYHIYGPVKDAAYWQQCQQVILQMPAHINVMYHGAIASDAVAAAVAASQVFILPSKSENYGHAIIEALQIGRPVITSEHTPWQHLANAKAGENVPLTVDAITAAIEKFANMDATTFQEYVEGAADYAAYAIQQHQLDNAYQRLFKA
ncbi:glycosyltransferase [Ferruginibacter yonginensis]|uniref:Glycosyltransferase n=1 Tax=Ferruginibacter yonginensis TaxID=1310416 RepID=A0ABV8QLU1_9BACT